LALVGCASPGPPRAPSLQLPEPVRDLTVAREGDSVTVRFTLPERTTDNLPIREDAVKASLCSAPEASPCDPLPSRRNVTLKLIPGATVPERAITWTVNLPPASTTGEPQLLAYRLQLSNLEGKTAGWSAPAYTASGAPPPPVEGLRASQTPSGILLRWQPAGSNAEVLLHRDSLAPPPGKKTPAEPVWLVTHSTPSGPQANETLDASAAEDMSYRYTAARRRIVELGEQKIELRSAASNPAEITWRNQFPPPAPTGLSAAPFSENGEFAVDLVWEPVEERGLKGYLVTRQAIDSRGSPIAVPQPLTPAPATLPAFHDASAQAGTRYRYSVRAVSHKGVASPPATIIVEPTTP
jgi:hypothetical protein